MTDTALDRLSLQNMEKKTTETFWEYAHKWKDLAAQVQPPMTDKELNKMFFNTLKAPYYDRMIGNSNTNFLDVVFVGEMIKNEVKVGKIESIEAKKPTLRRKRKRCMQCLTKEIIGAISHTTNMPGEARKGITSPILR